MTLIGFRNFKCVRGNLSVIFKGRGQEGEGELIVVDHENKQVSSVFSDVGQGKVDKDVDDIMGERLWQKQFKADKFRMEPVVDKKQEIRQKKIEGF